MGNVTTMKLTRVDKLTRQLDIIAKEYSKEAADEVNRGAFLIAERAQKMAPVLEGNLTASIKVWQETTRDFGGVRRRYTVGVDVDMPGTGKSAGVQKSVGDYAYRMHEGSYKLGPKSQAKQNANPRWKVGPKFLSKAAKMSVVDVRKNVEKEINKVTRRRARGRRR